MLLYNRFKFQYDNTLRQFLWVLLGNNGAFKFQYDNTLRTTLSIAYWAASLFKFQYDNTLSYSTLLVFIQFKNLNSNMIIL